MRHHRQRHSPRGARVTGFTLIETAIVLIIIGILLVSATKLMKQMQDTSRLKETQSKLEALQAVVVGYAQVNHKLPTFSELYPLVGTKGIEDAWGQPMTYLYADSLTSDFCASTTAPTIQFTAKNCLGCDDITNIAFSLTSAGTPPQDSYPVAATTINTFSSGGQTYPSTVTWQRSGAVNNAATLNELGTYNGESPDLTRLMGFYELRGRVCSS